MVSGPISYKLLFILSDCGHSKMNFIVGFPPEIQDSFVIKHVPSNARVFGYLDLKFHNLPAFGLKIRKIYRKYAKRGQVVKHL